MVDDPAVKFDAVVVASVADEVAVRIPTVLVPTVALLAKRLVNTPETALNTLTVRLLIVVVASVLVPLILTIPLKVEVPVTASDVPVDVSERRVPVVRALA